MGLLLIGNTEYTFNSKSNLMLAAVAYLLVASFFITHGHRKLTTLRKFTQ